MKKKSFLWRIAHHCFMFILAIIIGLTLRRYYNGKKKKKEQAEGHPPYFSLLRWRWGRARQSCLSGQEEARHLPHVVLQQDPDRDY